MFKKLNVFFITLALVFTFTSCTKTETEKETTPEVTQELKTSQQDETTPSNPEEPKEAITIEIAGPPAPPSLPLLRMVDANVMGEHVTLNFTKWDAIESLMAMANDEKVSFMGAPLNNSVVMYNKGLDIRLMNANTWSVMGAITTDESINTWEDLKGKTLYVPMKSSPIDFITQTFLKEHGIIPGQDIELMYTKLPEAPSLFLSGEAPIMISIEPQKTMILSKAQNARQVFSYKEEWQKLSGLDSDLPTAGLVGKGKFIDENPELAQEFQKQYEEALNWVLANPKEAAELANKYFGMEIEPTTKAIPNMALDFKSAKDSQDVLNKYYNILFEYNPDSVGGKLPDENFYYQQ